MNGNSEFFGKGPIKISAKTSPSKLQQFEDWIFRIGSRKIIIRIFSIEIAALLLALFWGILGEKWSEHISDEFRLITFLSGFQLFMISWLSWKIFQIYNYSGDRIKQTSAHVLWVVIAVGFFFLAIDELISIHEKMDLFIHYLFQIRETNLTDRIDDLIILLYGLIGICTLYFFRREVQKFPQGYFYLKIGFSFLLISVCFDVLSNQPDILLFAGLSQSMAATLRRFIGAFEEAFKIFSEGMFLSYFCLHYRMAKRIF